MLINEYIGPVIGTFAGGGGDEMVKAILLSVDQTVVRLAEAEVGKYNIEFLRIETVDQNGVAAALAEEKGADLVVLYGLHLPEGFLTESLHLPVVTIRFSEMDFLRLAQQWRNRKAGDGELAVVVSADMLKGEMDFKLLLGEGIRVYTVPNQGSVNECVSAAVSDGVRWIAGDIGVQTAAEAHGAFYIHFASGKEAVCSAIAAAEMEAARIADAKYCRSEISALVNANFGGVIKVDRQGRVVYISELAEYILECRNKMVVGAYVLNLFHSMEKEILDAVLENGEHIFKYVTGPRNKKILVNIEPLLVGRELSGAILSIQKWKSPQNNIPVNSSEGSENKARGRFDDYACRTELFRSLIKKLKFAAYADAPVLFYGEEGTETKGFANSLHNESHRHKMNFVEVECSAWDSERINEMLFGLQRLKEGEIQNKTVIEIAEGGTIFLNHIDAVSQELQFRIYCLIKGQYTLNSDPHLKKANVRVVAATDKDLRKMVREGTFRRDLYYALNVISFKIPPLRERKADIQDIVDLFVAHYENKYAKPVRLADGAYKCISEYDWPGNTRQLEYYCQKLMLTATSRNISEAYAREVLKDLGHDAAEDWGKRHDNEPVNAEAQQIIEVLKRNHGSKTQTATELGISKSTLWRRMQKYGITTDYSL